MLRKLILGREVIDVVETIGVAGDEHFKAILVEKATLDFFAVRKGKESQFPGVSAVRFDAIHDSVRYRCPWRRKSRHRGKPVLATWARFGLTAARRLT